MFGFGIVMAMYGQSLHLSESSQELKLMDVMTFNIRYGTANDGENSWENRKHLVFEMIRKHDPEVLGLQEALLFQIEEIVAKCPGYRWVGVGRDDGLDKGEFSPILTKSDSVGVLEYGTKWISETPDIVGSKGPGANLPRIFTWAKLRLRTGKTGFVVNTHFDHESSAARELGAQQIGEFIGRAKGDFGVVMGDFNAGLKSQPLQVLKGMGLTPGTTSESETGTFTGFKFGNTAGEQIDHILVDSRTKFSLFTIDRWSESERYPSDHFPIIAHLSQ